MIPAASAARLRRCRRGGVGLVLAMVVAFVPVVASRGSAAEAGIAAVGSATTHGVSRLPDVARNRGASAVIVSARPIRDRHAADGLALVGIIAGFAFLRRRRDLESGTRFRYDATFAHRRGPPHLLIAR